MKKKQNLTLIKNNRCQYDSKECTLYSTKSNKLEGKVIILILKNNNKNYKIIYNT